jgi:hypothetical protein
MNYLLIITMNPEVWDSLSEDEHNAVLAGHDRFQNEIVRPGELISSVALAEPRDTKTVRVRDGEPIVTDGPYAEAKEFLAGYYLVDCETLERATELAAAIPRRGVHRDRGTAGRAPGRSEHGASPLKRELADAACGERFERTLGASREPLEHLARRVLV